MPSPRQLFAIATAICTLSLTIWTILEMFQNGFNLWLFMALTYLVLVGVTLGFSWRREAKNISKLEAPNKPVGMVDKSAQETILEVIRANGTAQRHHLLPLVGISRSSLGRLLDQMEANGLIRQEGERKASYYVLAKK